MGHELYYTSDNVMDDGLNHIINNADQVVVCEDMPTSYADATTDKGSGGNALGEDSITPTGPEDGDSEGRKITYPAVTDIDVDVTGYFDFQAIVDTSGEELISVAPQDFEDIIDVDTGTDTVTIDGDHTDDMSADDDVTIRKSTGNNGHYTVDSVSLDGDGDTEVTLKESIDDSTADGYLIYGAVKLTEGGTANVGERDHTLNDAE